MVIKGEMSLDSLVFEEFSGERGGGGGGGVRVVGGEGLRCVRERRSEGEFV